MLRFLRDIRESLTTVVGTSEIYEGRLTPNEFVQAGDFLVQKYPSWKWASGDGDKTKSFLPDDKQFLVTHGIPSYPTSQLLIKEVGLLDEEDQEKEKACFPHNKDEDEWDLAAHDKYDTESNENGFELIIENKNTINIRGNFLVTASIFINSLLSYYKFIVLVIVMILSN